MFIRNISCINIKSLLIGLFGMAFLFIFFLFSDGLYHYYERDIGYPMIRVNKITGNLQSLNNGAWTDIAKEKR